MPFISYAQNFEDVMLWRALKHVENGLYIDLGAQDPLVDSVSLAFHQRGWKGIHVEPTPHYAQLLRDQRLGDTVIEAAVSNTGELITFYEIPDTGISTADLEIAQQHRERGFAIQEITVPVTKLSSIFKLVGGADIHWMKVDVEGFEFATLSSWGNSGARPWILVVESTLPMTQIESHHRWEHLLLKRGYLPAYFDGLNRFYVVKGKKELLDAFQSPPNVFDGFSLNGSASTTLHLHIEAKYKAELAAKDVLIQHAKVEDELLAQRLLQQEEDRQVEITKVSMQLETQKDDFLKWERERAKTDLERSSGLLRVQQELLERERDALKREEASAERLLQVRLEVEGLLRLATEREQQFTTCLIGVQEAAEREKASLREVAGAELEAVLMKRRDREERLAAELANVHQELLQREREALKREEASAERLLQVRLEVEGLLRLATEREQQFTTCLIGVQEAAEREKASLREAAAAEREGVVAEQRLREETLAAEVMRIRQELLERERAARKREEASAERLLQARLEGEGALRLVAEREQGFLNSLRLGEETRIEDEAARDQIEKELLKKVAMSVLTTAELQRALDSCGRELLTLQRTASWRLTAPFRALTKNTGTSDGQNTPAILERDGPLNSTCDNNNLTVEDDSKITTVISARLKVASMLSAGAPSNGSQTTNKGPLILRDTNILESLNMGSAQFIENAYVALLARPPDSTGAKGYLDRLASGTSREKVLVEISSSDEAVHSGIANLQGLLSLDGKKFIEIVYLTLLKRLPDTAGYKYYVEKLFAGKAKMQILAEICSSEEAQRSIATMPDVHKAVAQYKRVRQPIFGLFARMFANTDGDSPFETRLRVVEQQFFRHGQYVEEGLVELNASISNLQQIIEPGLAQIHRQIQQISIASLIPPGRADLKPLAAKTEQQRVIYYYVDHTVSCPTNTGLQRTVRMLARSLLASREAVQFVKWDNEISDLAFINRAELKHLSEWNGPDFALIDLETYPEVNVLNKTIDFHKSHEGCWLLVPEVTHINFHGAPKTREVLQASRDHGLKSAFIFYDAIPQNREELADVAPIHLEYMRQLRAADVVLPISKWSRDDFFKHTGGFYNEFKDNSDAILALPLPCESVLHTRTQDPAKLKKTAKDMILSVGSITPHKNQLMLVRAFNSYCNKHQGTEWTLNLVGHVHPAVSEELSQLVKLNHRVILSVGASDEYLREAYDSCSFTVFPSVEEGFGLPIGESLWFGKPCVCANFGAMKEVGSRAGCVSINTRNESEIEEAIESLIRDKDFLHGLYDLICQSELDTWTDYADKLIFNLKEFHTRSLYDQRPSAAVSCSKTSAKKRIFWLGMHKILVRTELERLRDLGYEVFNPKYLSEIIDQSAELNWNEKQETTLPQEIFAKLARTNFFYASPDDEVLEILNVYFDAVIVTIAPIWLEPIIKRYRRRLIYRVYGQAHSITSEFVLRDIRRFVEENEKFVFMPHASEAVVEEETWFRKNEHVVPYCLTDDIFGYQDSWDRSRAFGGEVALTCPNIANPFFGEHYRFIKNNFDKHFFKIYGVQTCSSDDPAVVGTLARRVLINRWREIACYVYTYDDPKVCYLPPIEIMIIGAPVLFVAGSLLDKYFAGMDTPARFQTPQDAIYLCERIRSGDYDLIDTILSFQESVRKRYAPAHVWPIFDRVMKSLI